MPSNITSASLIGTLRRWVRNRREQTYWRSQIAEWRACAAAITPVTPRGTVERLLILPSDPWTLTGAVGDDAMIEATVGNVRQDNPGVRVAIAVATELAAEKARAKGYEPLPFWREAFSFAEVVASLRSFQPDIVAALGADVMDGYYHPLMSMRLLLVSDLAARLGAFTTILGFSFNVKPEPRLKRLFERVHAGVKINVRDRISMDRFRAFTRAPADLVADVAFLLRPDAAFMLDAGTSAWLDAQRQAGRPVIGFNIHPMLYRHATPEQVERIIDGSVAALGRLLAERDASLLLIPHDYRGDDGDARCLAPIGERLANPNVHFLDGVHTAAQLKAIAGRIDGVIGARMHLLIATLGMAKPVAAVTYQDKFAGLFEHFGLPDWSLLSPEQFLAGALPDMMLRFFDEIELTRRLVDARLPGVARLSRDNLPDSWCA